MMNRGGVNKRWEEIKGKVEELRGKIIVGGDFNAKNAAWGGDITDRRGEGIFEWTETNNFKIENHRHDPPTFFSNRGIGWLDLQLTKHVDIVDREIIKDETLSDHRHIVYKMTLTRDCREGRRRYNTRKGKWEEFRRELRTWTDRQRSGDIEAEAAEFQEFCRSCCKKCIPLYKQRRRTKENIWWMDELENRRRDVNRKRKDMQLDQDEESRRRKEKTYRIERTA